jgi:sugar lactone lactonase YvrE
LQQSPTTKSATASVKTGLIYTSTEGNWLPKGGEVYEIDPDSGAVRIISSNRLWAADGLWIDQDNQILYVGQLMEHNVVCTLIQLSLIF